MLSDRFKTFFGESSGSNPGRGGRGQDGKEIVTQRQSRGLEQFFFNIRDQVGLSVLDLGGATQENVDFIASLGHRITTQVFLQTLDQTFGKSPPEEQTGASLIESFLKQNLDFPDESFDGILAWDVLQYMSPALLTATVDELFRIMRPKSYLLGFFNLDDKVLESPHCKFRIVNANTISLTQRGKRKHAQTFNNRNLERLFGKFESVKFFLTRESLREVIARR